MSVLLLICVLFFGCSKMQNITEQPRARSFGVAKYSGAANSNSAIMADMQMPMQKESYSDDSILMSETADGALDEKNEPNLQPKKIIKNGSVTIEVATFSDIENLVTNWAQSLGGYVSQSSTYEKDCHFTARVPAEKFEDAIESIGDIGVLKERSVSSTDVSEQYYDLATRLNNKRIMKEKLEKYLSQAKDVKDMLQIEVELNNTITDLENMTGRMKRLTGQIDYSTINVNAVLPYGQKGSSISKPKLSDSVHRFLVNVVNFFPKCLVVLLYIIICGIPVLAIICFLYWLLWGHVGLLKKLYKWLSK